MNSLLQTWEKEKKLLLFTLAATFFWGLVAHGYGILDSNFSHDSLTEFNGIQFGNHLKIEVGRFLVPIYRNFSRTDLTLPWLIGILGLLWCGLATYLALKTFQIESKPMIFVTAGIFTVNLTVSSTIATFIHDFDCDMLALLLAVFAAFCWKKHPWGWLAGAVPLMLSLALYQSYIATTIVLVMFVCILDLLDAVPFREVFLRGLKAIAMLLLGGLLYFITMRAAQEFTGLTARTGGYNTVDKALDILSLSAFDLKYLIKFTYLTWYEKFVNAISPYPAISSLSTKLILFFICGCTFLGVLKRNVKFSAKLLCLVLMVLLPFATNIMYFLTVEMSHELMRFAFWMTYLFALLLGRWLIGYLKEVKIPHISHIFHRAAAVPIAICMLLTTVVIHGNVQTANAMYLKKDLEHDAYMAVMNRVIYRMESFEGYEPGETPVVFVGLPEQMAEIVPGFETYRDPNGMYLSDVLNFSAPDRWRFYFEYVLMNPAAVADHVLWNTTLENPHLADMPAYPADGCMKIIDGVLVVKLG